MLPQNYNQTEIERKWQENWKKSGIYKWDSSCKREENFVIDTPPPTVSGLLHMGHIFSYTQADFIARFKRMNGMNVFYPIGFDDNGLPTERLVEKVKNIKAIDLPRDEFIAICKEVVKESEEEFRKLFQSVAMSFDWSQEYQTISDHCRKISQYSFIKLFEDGKAYRKMQPVFWDISDRTALAQADIVDQENKGVMNNIRFGSDLVIATTRPELLPACVAVFYHPDDVRYHHLQGKTTTTPIFGAEVPIIADDMVQIDKGTGLVMCCTFGDQQDILWWQKHHLPLKAIMGKNGVLENAGSLSGHHVKKAKALVIAMLQESGDLLDQVEVTQNVKCAERSGTPVEILVTPQWFIKVTDQKEGLLEKAAECNWHPEYMQARLESWINGLNWDWCISRQRFFGVPFPVWYHKETGEIKIASKDQLPIDPIANCPEGYAPDMDVMDTWATSSLTPQINSHFGFDDERHHKLFPADLRPQAHEIIRSWAFYTLAKSYLHENSVPWKNLMISGWCLAADKTKMSKSKGNVVTPVDLIIEKGADVVRYWASTSKLGADTAYSEDVMKIGKKLINKIWNAAKFAAIHFDKRITDHEVTNPTDLWVLSKLHNMVKIATHEFEQYEYSAARSVIEDFFWNDFCDNYLEISKTRAYQGCKDAITTLDICLNHILRLFAPFIPHITEEIYSHLYSGSVHAKGSWPDYSLIPHDEEAGRYGEAAIEILHEVRRLKAEKNFSVKAEISLLSIPDFQLPEAVIEDLKSVTNSAEIVIGEGVMAEFMDKST